MVDIVSEIIIQDRPVSLSIQFPVDRVEIDGFVLDVKPFDHIVDNRLFFDDLVVDLKGKGVGVLDPAFLSPSPVSEPNFLRGLDEIVFADPVNRHP